MTKYSLLKYLKIKEFIRFIYYIIFKFMTQFSHFVNLTTDSTAIVADYKARVTANGVALLFAYLVNNF